jgi:hypothetical protein
LKTAIPWPWVGLGLALGVLVVWWESSAHKGTAAWPTWLEPLVGRLQPLWQQAKAAVAQRATLRRPIATLERWRTWWLGQHAAAILPIIALMSLAGGPLTAGWWARWPFYAALLKQGQASLLIAAIGADTLLAAGLWTAIARTIRSAGDYRPKVGALLSMMALAGLLVWFGIAPDKLATSVGLRPGEMPDVSVWGLGLVFGLPWLIGAWLARAGKRLGRRIEFVQSFAQLEWLYRIAAQAGQKLAGGVYWLGMVGEGEGWWGWALIILALGTLFLTLR